MVIISLFREKKKVCEKKQNKPINVCIHHGPVQIDKITQEWYS